MTRYVAKPFSGEVELDGHEFIDCDFRGATLVFSGGKPPTISGCELAGSKFEFRGAAANTLSVLQGMSQRDSGLQAVVRASLPGLLD
jgi:hypothetical protein